MPASFPWPHAVSSGIAPILAAPSFHLMIRIPILREGPVLVLNPLAPPDGAEPGPAPGIDADKDPQQPHGAEASCHRFL